MTTSDSASVRQRIGWKQPQMAHFLGMTQSGVSALEQAGSTKRATSRLLDLLSAALDDGRVRAGMTSEEALRALGFPDSGRAA